MNTAKTKLMVVDGVATNRTDPVGFCDTPNGNMKTTMDLVMERTLRAKETIQGHPLGPKETVEVFGTKEVGNFRYLVTVPWKKRDLESR